MNLGEFPDAEVANLNLDMNPETPAILVRVTWGFQIPSLRCIGRRVRCLDDHLELATAEDRISNLLATFCSHNKIESEYELWMSLQFSGTPAQFTYPFLSELRRAVNQYLREFWRSESPWEKRLPQLEETSVRIWKVTPDIGGCGELAQKPSIESTASTSVCIEYLNSHNSAVKKFGVRRTSTFFLSRLPGNQREVLERICSMQEGQIADGEKALEELVGIQMSKTFTNGLKRVLKSKGWGILCSCRKPALIVWSENAKNRLRGNARLCHHGRSPHDSMTRFPRVTLAHKPDGRRNKVKKQ